MEKTFWQQKCVFKCCQKHFSCILLFASLLIKCSPTNTTTFVCFLKHHLYLIEKWILVFCYDTRIKLIGHVTLVEVHLRPIYISCQFTYLFFRSSSEKRGLNLSEIEKAWNNLDSSQSLLVCFIHHGLGAWNTTIALQLRGQTEASPQ